MTPEEKSAMIEARQLRKVPKMTTKVAISPIPLSSYIATAPSDKAVMRYMFPADGIIKKSCIYVEEITKEGISVSAKLSNEVGAFSRELSTRRKLTTISMDIGVLTGDRLEILVDGEYSGLWVSLLWQPKKNALALELLEDPDAEGSGEKT